MFQLITGALALYVIAHVWPLLAAWPVLRLLVCAALLVASQHHDLTRRAFGTMFSAEVPRVLIIGVNILFATLVLSVVFYLLLDLVRLVLWLAGRSDPGLQRGLDWGAFLGALALSSLGVASAIGQPALRELRVPIRDLPAAFDGFRVLHLTDLHLSRLFHAPWAEELVRRANALGADVILITGDLIDGTLEARRADVAPLAGLQAPEGVFVVSGNHEYYFDHDRWMDHYRSLGMQVLQNSHVVLGDPGAALIVAGVPDLSAAHFNLTAPDLTEALAGAPEGQPVILMNHQPITVEASAEAGVDLHLSGHTHGGMIRGLDRLIARFNRGYVSGFYAVGDTALYVSNGTALWPGFAVRLGVPAELTVFTLVRG